MSSTGHGAIRVENDFYPTPDWVVDVGTGLIRWDRVRSFEEPCKGTGAILDKVPAGVETHWCEIAEGRDYLTEPLPKVDLTQTNPPFELAMGFLRRAIEHSKCVSLLLRCNFLGSAERRDYLQAHRPTHQHVLSRRPSFVDVCKGKESITYGAGGRIVDRKKIKGCGWAFQKVDQVKACPNCGGKVAAGTDSIEYAWFAWDSAGIMNVEPGIYVV